jgi:hypothetical protein
MVPDLFMAKNADNPLDAPATNPRGLTAANRGWVPTSATLEQTSGIYVAFSRPGDHRITLGEGISEPAQAREVQDKGKQITFYNRNVSDVTVTAAGRTINENDTVSLLQTQRLPIQVTPDGLRRYAVQLLRPDNGATLRAEDDLVIIARTRNGSEEAEICRVYRYDAASEQFDSGGLMEHGLHLPACQRMFSSLSGC